MLPALLACVQLNWPGQAVAEPVSAGPGAPAVHSSRSVDLDLSSTTHNVTPGLLRNFQPIAIVVNGRTQLITSTTMLTPAETIALSQVLRSGVQSLNIGASGNAVGGNFVISPQFARHISALTVPQGVAVIDRAAALNLAGNLTNAGTFYACSTNPSVTTAVVSALNISNQQGAQLTTVLPQGGLTGLTSPNANLNLQLNAVNSIVNGGTISSAANLVMTAGGSIVNALPSAVSGSQPIVRAAKDIKLQASVISNQGLIGSQSGNLTAATASLTNSGIMQALAGSITVQTSGGNTLSINNASGTIASCDQLLVTTLGSVLAPDNSVSSAANLTVYGGHLSAGEVSFTSPDGAVNVQTDSIKGNVSVEGCTAEVGTNQGGLNIVSIHVSGDPIFFSHDPSAGLVLSGLGSTSGGDFIALAEGDITTSDTGNVTINATNFSGTGGLILLAAGVTFTTTNGTSPMVARAVPGVTTLRGHHLTEATSFCRT